MKCKKLKLMEIKINCMIPRLYINKENLVLTIDNYVFYNFFTITSDN